MSNKPANAITDFPALYPRQTRFNRYTVLSLANDTTTAYQVDIDELTCSCPDHRYEPDEGDVCKHLAAALFEASKNRAVEQEAVRRASSEVQALRQAVESMEQSASSVEAEAAAAAQQPAQEGSADSSSQPDDPVEAVKQAAVEAGVPVGDGVSVYEHEEFGSIQVEKTGYIDDEEFQAMREFTDQDAFTYDQDSGTNYVRPEDVGEVV